MMIRGKFVLNSLSAETFSPRCVSFCIMYLPYYFYASQLLTHRQDGVKIISGILA